MDYIDPSGEKRRRYSKARILDKLHQKKVYFAEGSNKVDKRIKSTNHKEKSMKQILSLDSQMLNSIQFCPRHFQYSFLQHLRPIDKPAPLERGDLIHKMLELYYGLKFNCLNPASDTLSSLQEAGIPLIDDTDFVPLVRFCCEAGQFFGAKTNLPVEEIEESIFQFNEYANHFQFDGWKALETEGVGARVMYDSEDLQIIYMVKIDMIAEKDNFIAVWDHKTASRRVSEVTSLSNQFMGYAWAMGLDTVIVNRIGFQKSLSRGDRFQRFILKYTPDRLKEWEQNSVYWATRLGHQIEQAQAEQSDMPMNLTSCDKYNGCVYRHICEKSTRLRDMEMEKTYKVAEKWDVAKILEAKQ